jgi:hypothetical protein
MTTLLSGCTVRTMFVMADDKRVELRVSEEWLGQVDDARGDMTRAGFIKDAVRRRSEQVLKAAERAGRRSFRQTNRQTGEPKDS